MGRTGGRRVKQPHTPETKRGTSRVFRRSWGPLNLGRTAATLMRRPSVRGTSKNHPGYFTMDDMRRGRELRAEWAAAHRFRSRVVETAYSLDRWVSSVLHLTWYRRTRTFIIRGRRGWAPRDVWSLDDYLCRVIGAEFAHVAGLVGDTVLEIDRTNHGHPCAMTAGEWRDILLNISGPLRRYKDHWDKAYEDGKTYEERTAAAQQIIDEAADAFRLLADHLPSLWD